MERQPGEPVTLTPYGPSPATVHIPPGGTVEWVTSLGYSSTLSELASLIENPILRILSSLNPLTNSLGFDGGMQTPGQVYRRQFDQAGTYDYSDGAGHYGHVNVTADTCTYTLSAVSHDFKAAKSTLTVKVTGTTACGTAAPSIGSPSNTWLSATA